MVMLSYPSANRDEDVYDDPFRFDVGRQPNKHLAFGFDVHYCLGAMLARMELKALLTELVPRLRSIELAAAPRYMQTLFVGGPKSGSPAATRPVTSTVLPSKYVSSYG